MVGEPPDDFAGRAVGYWKDGGIGRVREIKFGMRSGLDMRRIPMHGSSLAMQEDLLGVQEGRARYRKSRPDQHHGASLRIECAPSISRASR